MILQDILEQVGLDEREAKVYLAALELGESTVLPIALKADIKRTYCYDILDSLQKRGLVNHIQRNNRRCYFAEDPEKILTDIQNHASALRKALPELRSMFNKPTEKPKIQYYEGREGLIKVYEMSGKAKELWAVASPRQLEEYLGDYFTEHSKEVLKSKIRAKELVTAEGSDAPYLRYFKQPYQEVRVLPENLTHKTDFMIFDSKLAMVSYGKVPHVVLIESAEIVETQKILFTMAWNQSRTL